jgi:hypothetical protein
MKHGANYTKGERRVGTFVAKCEYCKNEIRCSGNMTNLKVHLERCKFSPSRKESLTKKNNQREKEINSSNTDNGDKNMEIDFKDDSEVVSITY